MQSERNFMPWWRVTAWVLGVAFLLSGALLVQNVRTGAQQASSHVDELLEGVARVVMSQRTPVFSPSAIPPQDPRALSVFVWGGTGQLVTRFGTAPQLPITHHEGFSTVVFGSPPQTWRSFSEWDGPERNRKVAVMIKFPDGQGVIDGVLSQLASPLAFLLPAFAALFGWATYLGLRPVRRIG